MYGLEQIKAMNTPARQETILKTLLDRALDSRVSLDRDYIIDMCRAALYKRSER